MVKVAIIEDDVAIAQMYRFKFEAEGYTVETAENGKIGLELAESMKPDMILLDLMMPVMTGEEMLSAMRKTAWGKDIKVVILTNRGEAGDNVGVLLRGIDREGVERGQVLCKPRATCR